MSCLYFFFSSRRRHTRFDCDWSSDVCSSDLERTRSARRGKAMRMLVIGFIFWIFIVPSLAGSFLILAFLAAFVPPLYFALTWFAIAFTTALVLCGPFWIVPLAHSGFSSSPRSRQK